MTNPEQTPLNSNQRNAIYSAIYTHMTPDDRWPDEVIDDNFGGDEKKYLEEMSSWHGVILDQDTQTQKERVDKDVK